jgi:hypothetical protein
MPGMFQTSQLQGVRPVTKREMPMNLQQRLMTLTGRHAALEEQLSAELTRPRADDTTVTRIKREKLRLKEEMERLRQELQPT